MSVGWIVLIAIGILMVIKFVNRIFKIVLFVVLCGMVLFFLYSASYEALGVLKDRSTGEISRVTDKIDLYDQTKEKIERVWYAMKIRFQ